MDFCLKLTIKEEISKLYLLTNIIRTSNIVTKQYKVLTLKSTWIQEELEDLRRKWNYTLLY